MIFSELRNYLVQATSIETVDLFDRGFDIFEKFEIEELMDAYELALGEATIFGETAVADAIQKTFVTQLDDLVNAHGIYLKDDVVSSVRVTILEGLWLLTQHDEPERLLGILDAASSPEEAFCELIAFVTIESEDNLLSYIESVDLSLLSTLKTLVVKQGEQLIQATDVQTQIKDYSFFKSLYPQPIYADLFFKSPASVGLPYSVYINAYLENDASKDTSSGETNEPDIKNTAWNLLGLCVLSEETAASALPTIREYLELVYSDINLITKLDITLISIITEFNNVKTRSF